MEKTEILGGETADTIHWYLGWHTGSMNADRLTAADSHRITKAQSFVRRGRLSDYLQMMVDIASPTGEEGALARQIVQFASDVGLQGQEQVIDATQSNALIKLPGSHEGAALLLYSPIDTVTSNSVDEDVPWVGPELRDDMLAKSWIDDDYVYGLGAQNPKGHAACVLAAGEAIHASGAPLTKDLYLGFGAGGMPTNARPGMRPASGHGAGCAHMIESLPPIDAAIIAKSGWCVSWEEVGLAWYTVKVAGTHSYVGSRHLLPFSNAITNAGRLIERLEAWFADWAETHRSGLVAPQGVVSYIHSGWSRMPAFTPAECQFQVDLRVSPRTSAMEADRAFGKAIKRFSAELGIESTWQRTVSIPGTTTDPDANIVRSCIKAWEAAEGKAHTPVTGMSGATDANILRQAKIPTARIGLGKADIKDIDFELGMNVASLDDMERLTRLLIHVAINTCSRSMMSTCHG